MTDWGHEATWMTPTQMTGHPEEADTQLTDQSALTPAHANAFGSRCPPAAAAIANERHHQVLERALGPPLRS
jgi:hypothetical protein